MTSGAGTEAGKEAKGIQNDTSLIESLYATAVHHSNRTWAQVTCALAQRLWPKGLFVRKTKYKCNGLFILHHTDLYYLHSLFMHQTKNLIIHQVEVSLLPSPCASNLLSEREAGIIV
jgi:hypothetical protein